MASLPGRWRRTGRGFFGVAVLALALVSLFPVLALIACALVLTIIARIVITMLFLMIAIVLLFPVCFFQGFQADLPHQVHKSAFFLLRLPCTDLNGFQSIRHDILQVQLADLSYPFNSKGILLIAVRQHIPHQVLKNILFNEDGCSLGHLQGLGIIREVLQRIQVGVQLIVQTSF